jgi:hypothetical protein
MATADTGHEPEVDSRSTDGVMKETTWFISFRGGLRYNASGSGPGAQTERPGVAGPVRVLLAGTTSPAVFFEEESSGPQRPRDTKKTHQRMVLL